MAILATIFGILLILFVLWEGFETIVLPRGVTFSQREVSISLLDARSKQV